MPSHLAVLPALLVFATPLFAAELTLDIAGFATTEGTAMIAIYDTPQAMADDKGLTNLRLPVSPGKAVRAVVTLPPGRYAIAVFHDQNGNGQLDRNLLGLPSEAYGFGNDARGNFGPPSFEQAAIPVSEKGAQARITVR